MEEYDDLAQGPNESGSFNLSYGGWNIVPYEICTEFSTRLIYLNLSHNSIAEITDQIGNLTVLKELNLSHNTLKKISLEIGKCVRLRKIDFSENQLESLPVDLFSKCKFLVRYTTSKIMH
jgi:Leucine-rich repeat (LRR) protein